MQPIRFPESNIVFGEGQEEYQPLPAFVDPEDPRREVISCWRLGWRERLRLLVTGRVWLRQLTFRSPLQPQVAQVDYPFVRRGPFDVEV